MKQVLSRITEMKLSQIFFWLFLVSIPFNKRIIYNSDQAYINGYFSYYLAVMVYLSDILFFLCLISYLMEKRGIVLQKRQKWLIFGSLWLILASLGLFHMKQITGLALYQTLKLIEIAGLIWLTTKFTDQLNIRYLTYIIFLSGIFQFLLGFWQFHVQHSLSLTILGEYVAPLGTGGLAMIDTKAGQLLRAYGTFPHPNILGFYLVIALILGYLLIVSRETSQKARKFLFFGDFLLILGIFLTFSRISWLLAGISTLMIGLYAGIKEKRLKLAFFLLTIVSCATILVFWGDLIPGRVGGITESKAFVDRGTLNHFGLEVIKKYPLGIGAGNYVPTIQDMFHVQPWEYQPPHNIFIYVAAILGLPGITLLLLMLLNPIKQFWRTKAREYKFSLVVLGLALLVVSNLDHFLVTIQQGQLMLGLSLGLILGYDRPKS